MTARPASGLLVADRVLPLDGDINSLIEHWDTAEGQLDTLAASAGKDTGLALADVEVLAPVEPVQVLQTGANYRKHVIDLAAAHREPGQDEDEVRAKTAAMMDKRAGQGTPYFFIGLPTAIASATDDLTLPSYSKSHDWELELAAVIGRTAFRVTPEEALEYVFGYTMVNDITTREYVFRKDMPAIGSDWYRAKNAPGFLPTGPAAGARQVLRRPAGRPGDAEAQRQGHAGRVHAGHDLRRGQAGQRSLPDHAAAPGRPGPDRKPRRQRPALGPAAPGRRRHGRHHHRAWAPS